jgi:hypothetical protein
MGRRTTPGRQGSPSRPTTDDFDFFAWLRDIATLMERRDEIDVQINQLKAVFREHGK